MAALVVLSVLIWWVDDSMVEAQVGLSLLGILLMAAAVLVGPLGAGVLGILVAGLSRRPTPWSARLFNVAVASLLGVVVGMVYLAAGGWADTTSARGVTTIVRTLALPLATATVVQVVLNVALIVGILRITQAVPIRVTVGRLLRSTGLMGAGSWLLAVLLVTLWQPAGLGAISVVILLVPLIGVQWVLAQVSASLRMQEQSVELLVAAIELRLPHLQGHAARVAALSERMADQAGLSIESIRDVQLAARLHDLGQATRSPLDPALDPMDLAVRVERAQRAAELLSGLPFLAGAVAILRRFGRIDHTSTDESAIVTLAAAYDRLAIEGDDVRIEDVLDQPWITGPADPRVVEALSRSIERAHAGAGT